MYSVFKLRMPLYRVPSENAVHVHLRRYVRRSEKNAYIAKPACTYV